MPGKSLVSRKLEWKVFQVFYVPMRQKKSHFLCLSLYSYIFLKPLGEQTCQGCFAEVDGLDGQAGSACPQKQGRVVCPLPTRPVNTDHLFSLTDF